MRLSSTEAIYVAVVLAVGAYALVRSLAFLRATRTKRIEGVERRRRFESIRTRPPIEDAKDVARERGIESIESQFTVLRRLVAPFIVGTTLLLASVPFVADASATTASLVGTMLAVILGLALRPFLENAVAGLVISSSRLMRIGDTVRIDDMYGTVEDITATHTAVKVWDWRRYLVPNSRMLQSSFFNYSLYDTYQWAHVQFWIAPDADLELARELALAAPLESPHYSGHEPPRFWVIGIEKDAVECWVAAWASTPSDAWALTHDVRTKLLRELRARGIERTVTWHRWSPGTETSPTSSGPFPGPPPAPAPSPGS